MANVVTSGGSVGVYILNPLMAGMSVRGLVNDGVFFEAAQGNDNARRVLLTSGGTTLLTNSARNGTLTITVARVSPDLVVLPGGNPNNVGGTPSVQNFLNALIPGVMVTGDLVLYCGFLQQTGQSTGSQITVYYDINGTTEITTFLNCGLKRCDPLRLSGSEVQTYSVQFDYSDFIRS